jgi:hypothetical protein
MQPALFLRINIDNNKPKLEPKWLNLCCKFGTGYSNAFERQWVGRPLSPIINKRRQKGGWVSPATILPVAGSLF